MKKIIAFLCVFMYFMSPYRLAGHEMPELIGMLALMLVMLSRPTSSINNKYLIYMLYMWFVPPVCAIIVGIPGDHMSSFIPIALIITSCYLCILLPSVDKVLVLKYYRVLVYVAVVFFIVQEISFLLFGYRPTLYLPFFEMYYDGMDMASFSASRSELARSSSFFLEPSHFAQYIIPYYCIILFKYIKERKGIFELLLLTSVIILLQAGVGYVIVMVIYIYVLLKSEYLKFYQRVLILFIGSLGLVLALTAYSNTEFVTSILNRTTEFSMEVDPYGRQSGFIRIWRGYFIYGAMDLVNQLFGVGVGGVDYVSSAVYIPGCRFEGSFSNGIQALLIMGGVLGLFLFLWFIFSLYKSLNHVGRAILISMMTLFFLEHMLYTPKMFLYILLAQSVTDIEKIKYRTLC